ncbi:MarR family winged helix-turn-helix transcriptional regulator [Nitrospirillum viridazoti]|uniref:MarR family transcriptional regulator n=1 Tax=Nitrospirillum viridazoti CBAmc TaxID=1441467 RepID=A0A248JVY5_9PROT|nr:MarR family winged helix-turn-helix transcriptional regulator [Nitrospirillum amazonense]ASG22877.1 MarR family transcriptional regulator [Nitrospirillum amazonense CBAmc]TWB33659.1 MarR family transcriptional regulator [Nitrospirillum amazonense]
MAKPANVPSPAPDTESPAQPVAVPLGVDNPLALDRQLCFALYQATNRITRAYRPLLDALGLTYPQYLALMVLWEGAPLTVGDLGSRLDLDSGTLTPLLKRMEAAGLVARRRDPADERRVLVDLTPAAWALRDKALAIPGAMLCRFPVPLDEVADLRDRLHQLAAALGAG